MKTEVQTISDDNGIEVVARFGYDLERGYEAEPGNPNTFVPGGVYIELKEVLVVIGERAIDILPLLHPGEKDFLINKIQFK